jgi:hypothetical protein
MSTNDEPLSDLEIQRINQERSEPEDGPLAAYLQFALKSLESAAATLDLKAEPVCEVGRNFGPHLVPDSKRWSLFKG